MKMQIAIYTKPGAEIGNPDIWPVSAQMEKIGYVRRSEIIEVDFPELAREETLPEEMRLLAEMERLVLVESERQLNVIKEQRAKLLAIGFDKTEAA